MKLTLAFGFQYEHATKAPQPERSAQLHVPAPQPIIEVQPIIESNVQNRTLNTKAGVTSFPSYTPQGNLNFTTPIGARLNVIA